MDETRPLFLLRPLSVGDILDMGFSIYRRWWRPLVAASALAYVPYAVLYLLWLYGFFWGLAPGVSEERIAFSFLASLPLLLVTLLYFLTVYPLTLGMVSWMVAQAFLGREVSLREALGRVRQRLGVLIGATLLEWLLVGVGMVFCCVPGLALLVLFACLQCVVVMEAGGVLQSLGRSYELMRGTFWKGAAVVVLGYLLATLVGAAFQMPAFLLTGVESWRQAMTATPPVVSEGGLWIQMLQTTLGTLGSMLAEPLRSAFFVLLYYDLRIRREALDLHLLAEAMGYGPSLHSCPRCGFSNPASATFCGRCGAMLGAASGGKMCPRCRRGVRAEARFCPYCGTSLSSS